jgi:hypothetical protein
MEVKNMMFFELLAGLALAVVVGGIFKTIGSGGGSIVGRDNVRNAIEKEERNLKGRFNDLKVTKNDPKFYE